MMQFAAPAMAEWRSGLPLRSRRCFCWRGGSVPASAGLHHCRLEVVDVTFASSGSFSLYWRFREIERRLSAITTAPALARTVSSRSSMSPSVSRRWRDQSRPGCFHTPRASRLSAVSPSPRVVRDQQHWPGITAGEPNSRKTQPVRMLAAIAAARPGLPNLRATANDGQVAIRQHQGDDPFRRGALHRDTMRSGEHREYPWPLA